MLQLYCDLQGGASYFDEHIHEYLSEHQYSNAETQDLWDALTEKNLPQISSIMNSWTSQPGYPVVRFFIFFSFVNQLAFLTSLACSSWKLYVTKVDGGVSVFQERFFSHQVNWTHRIEQVHIHILIPYPNTYTITFPRLMCFLPFLEK